MKSKLLFILGFLIVGCGSGTQIYTARGQCYGYRHPEDALYILPWSVGTSNKVVEANCSGFQNNGRQRYAYTFQMNDVDFIVASRAGWIINFEEKYDDGVDCHKVNFVEIRHKDLTVGLYEGFSKNGIFIEPDQFVSQGEVLGTAGDRGCDLGTQLRFGVYHDDNLKDTVVINFKNALDARLGLQKNVEYQSQIYSGSDD